MKTIPLDPPKFSGNEAIEILQIWIDRDAVETTQKFSIKPVISKDPAAWGLLLVDIARHVATGYSETAPEDYNFNEVLLRIKEGFDVEWENPT